MGYGKNNRRRGKVVVSRKKKRSNHKYKTKFIGDEKMQGLWDHAQTVKENYANLGFVADPTSTLLKQQLEQQGLDAQSTAIEFFDVPDSDIMNDRNPRKKENHMSVEETKYLEPLIEKYGDAFEKMMRDIKLNTMQWTTAKLKRRIARLRLFQAKVL